MWIFKALFRALKGEENNDYADMLIDKALQREKNGEDITPEEEK
jgi:hypothetical protein